MSAPRYHIIACHVLWRELCHFAALSRAVCTFEFLEQGLHNTPDVLRAEVQKAAGELMNAHDFTTPIKMRLMEKLAEITPGEGAKKLTGMQHDFHHHVLSTLHVHFDARKLKTYTGNYTQFERERAQQLADLVLAAGLDRAGQVAAGHRIQILTRRRQATPEFGAVSQL